MHHKRKRPKHQRAGCLVCKRQTDERFPRYGKRTNGWKRPRPSSRVAVVQQLAESA